MVDFLFFEHPVMDEDDWKTVSSDSEALAILEAAIAAYESCAFEPEELHRVTGRSPSRLDASLRKRRRRSGWRSRESGSGRRCSSRWRSSGGRRCWSVCGARGSRLETVG